MRKRRVLSTKFVSGFRFCIAKLQIIIFPLSFKLIIVKNHACIDFFTHPPLQDAMVCNLEKRLTMFLTGSLRVGEYLSDIFFLPTVKVRIKSARR